MFRNSISSALLTIAALLCFASVAQATVWYVDDDATGSGTGPSWTDAFVYLQDALAVAQDGDEIRVAQGTYRPDERSDWTPGGSGDREASFWLIDGVGLYGGYAGVGAPDPDERDPALYETILSGDLAEDDGPDFVNYSENSIHVVRGVNIDETTVLEGLTMTGGNANAGSSHEPWRNAGGALFNRESSPSVVECVFRDNRSIYYGGAVHNFVSSNAVYSRCKFTGNDSLFGGALSNLAASHAHLEECFFLANNADTGGAVYNTGTSHPSLDACAFYENTAHGGGAIYSHDSDPTIIACVFEANSARDGGAIKTGTDSGPTITDCAFVGNFASDSGGAMSNWNDYEEAASLTRCTFIQNSAGDDGGSIATYDSSISLTDCAFYGNTADRGGALHFERRGPALVGCILAGNAATIGGAVFLDGSYPRFYCCSFGANDATHGRAFACDSHNSEGISRPTLTSVILGNGGNEIWVGDESRLSITFSAVQGGWPGYGNIDADPLFADPDGPDDTPGTEDDDLHLLPGSPCINAGFGYLAELPDFDFDGNPRIQQCRVDMGAYESLYGPVTFPDCNDNWLDDDCEIYAGSAGDCNENHVADECDIAEGASYDTDGSEVPDECEDCNGNGVPDAFDSDESLFYSVWTWAGALDTTAPVAQDIHLPGRAQLRRFRVYYTSTGSSPGNMMVRLFDGGTEGTIVPAYPEGLLGEYFLGHLSWLPGDQFSYKYTNVEPALPLPSHLWMEVEINRDGGVMLRSEPPAVGFTQGLVYDRDAAEMLVGPLYMGFRIYGLQCALDCNGNDIEDTCDVACGPAGGPCDVPGCGQSDDCNANGVPDECEPDCNDNGVADECDIIAGTSEDDNDNGTPDECEPAADLKPGACPNSFNRASHGVLPVGLLGTATLDAVDIDISTVRLSRTDGIGGSVAPHEGPPGPHSVYEDVGTPFNGEACDCHDTAGDGILDLSMKFKTDDVVADLLLNYLDPGALVELVVRGNLLDGSPFAGSDCIRLVPPGTPPGVVVVQSNAAGAWIEVQPLDLQLDGGGFADFERAYPLGSVVTLAAEESYDSKRFVGWRLDGEFVSTEAAVAFATSGEVHTVQAVMLRPGDIDGDDQVNLIDFATFALCYQGSGATTPPAGCEAESYASSDFDGDGDVDLSDFATFATSYGT